MMTDANAAKFSDISVTRLMGRIVRHPERYKEILCESTISDLVEVWQKRQNNPPRKQAQYLGAGLVWCATHQQLLNGRRDLGIYISQSGTRVPMDVIDEMIKSYLLDCVEDLLWEQLRLSEANDLARRYIRRIEVAGTDIVLVPRKQEGAK